MSLVANSDDLEQRLGAIPASAQLRFVPLRHHSPACAHHLQEIIQRDKPELVLIEGPADATALLPYLTEKDAKPPLALYFYHCNKAVDWLSADESVHRQRGFYPMADFSPEWVAIRAAAKIGAETRLIDLPYAARPETLSPEGIEQTLLTDIELANANPTARMVELSGCRDFNEWWDRYFESGGLEQHPDDYFRQVLSWCLLLRDASNAENDSVNAARESFMAAHVREAVATGKRVLVITGGFHSEAIANEFVDNQDSTDLPQLEGEQGMYLVPYTLGRLDTANDYAAGIANSGYYQEVWQELAAGEQRPHSTAARRIAVRVGQNLQARGELVSLPDSVEAVTLSHRLGQLRGVVPGRAELFDAMQTAFVKDMQNAGSEARLLDLVDLDRKGQLPKRYPKAPLVEDFRNQCHYFKLPLGPLDQQEKQLDIYRSKRHRQISRLLHRVSFLSVPYGERTAGPDFAKGRQLERVREIWQLQWSPDTEALLTERMAYGCQLQQAALNYLAEQLEQQPRSGPELLIEALQMGLHQVLDQVLEKVRQWFDNEGRFELLVEGLSKLVLAYNAHNALAAHQLPALRPLLAECFERACLRLAWVGQTDDKQALILMHALADLNTLAQTELDEEYTHSGWADVPLFIRCVAGLYQAPVAASVRGCAAAILTSRKVWSRPQAEQALTRAFDEALCNPGYLGGFLLGFLPLARAQLIQSASLIDAIEQVVAAWDEELFLEVLPDLRLAFTSLKPRETISFSKAVGLNPEEVEEQFTDVAVWSEDVQLELQGLSSEVDTVLRRWGIGDA